MPVNLDLVKGGLTPPGGQSGNGTGAQAPQSTTYTFDGQTYNTREEAYAARDQYIADRKNKIMSIYADAASVGFDKSKFDALMQSGAGLSQMSDAERSYITKRYQVSNPYERKSYTNSAADQYLASVGMPAYNELNTYRKAYYDYASGGGVLDNFPGLDDDTYRYISKHWKDGMQTGIDGKLYTAKGKEVQYKDTLLDDQLKSVGLPPASMINDYFLDYQQDKQIDADIKDFYAAVYEKTKTGMSGEEAYRTTLAEPKYLPLSQYVSEAVVYPNEADYTDNDVLSDTYGQTDKAKFDTAWNKALTADAKRDAMDHRVSYDDYKAYSARQNETRRWEQLEKQHTTAKQNAAKWFTTPATSDSEKQQRATEMKQYLGIFEPNTTVDSMQTYFALLDAGVPYETILRGPASITAWNESSNASSPTYADVKLLSQGYSADDGDYAANKEIVRQTQEWTKRPMYESSKEFYRETYDKELSQVDILTAYVSPAGYMYAKINGITPVDANFAGHEDLMSLYTYLFSYDNGGQTRLVDYITDEERGVFNCLFRQQGPDKAMDYLDGLSDMLEDRRYVDRTGTFAARLATDGVNVSEGEIANYVYDSLLYEQGQVLEDVNPEKPDAWHLEAWQKYAGYSDEALQQMAEEANVDPTLHGPNETQWVLDTRKELRTRANVEAALYGYTDEAGKAATAEHDYSADIVPKAPDEKETSFAEQFARSSMGGPDWSSTIEYVRDGGYAHDVEQPIFDQMSESQRDQYNWLYKNKGAEAAQAFYQLIRPSLSEAAAEGIRAERKAYGKENKIAASLASVPGTFLSGMTGLVGSALNLATGTELTESQAASWNFSNQWREGVSEDWAPGWQFLYGAGMSMADSAVTALMAAAGMPAGTVVEGGLVADFATAWMASSAYTATLDSAMSRGLDPSQAYGTALVAGIAEYVTEKISLDSLLEGVGDVSKAGKGSLTKAYFTNVAKQAFVEGTEEVNSDVINFLWDNLVNGDMSEFNQNVDSLIDAGYTREEARQIAWKQQIIDTSLSFAGGALSGGLMGAGSGGFGVRAALYDYAFGAEGTQADMPASAPATAPAQTGASVRVHADAYASGRSVVDRIFGQTVGDSAQHALDTRESESMAKRIDAISEGITTLDNTSYLYRYTHDAKGNLTLTDDQRVALASVLALAYEDAKADNMDAAFIHAMAQLQTEQQRAANTNYGWIKNAQDVRNVIDQIAKTQESISTIKMEQQTKLADAQAAYSAAAGEVEAITKKQEAAADIEDWNSLQDSLKTAIDKAANLKSRLNTIETTDAANAEARIKAANEEIARQQTLLDRHYASASAFLSEYAPASFDGSTAAREFAAGRAMETGAEIDSIMKSDMSDSDKEYALGTLRERLGSIENTIRSIDARLSNANPAALSNAMNAMKSNSVSDFIKAQSETAQKAAQSAQAANVEDSSTTAENGENKAADGVKQDDAKQSTRKKKTTITIGSKVQQTFNRIAKKFGCNIVWGDDSTAIGNSGQTLKGRNGAYNAKEPNKIYLNKVMMCDRSMSSTQAVAREFFTHEIVHYVANTKTYRNIMARAAAYYNTVYGKNGADTLVNAIIADEQRRGNTGFGRKQALEEMTAHFAQEVLFAGADGNRRALVWLARSDKGMVSNFLTTVEYLIKRGNVRKANDSSTVKTMLIDAEFELITALKERQYLDMHGQTSAFQRRANVRANASQRVTNAQTEAHGQAQAETQTQAEASTTSDIANSQKSGTPTDTVSDIRAIFTGKGNDVMNSRGMTVDDYMAMDFSKNKLLQKNGKPYKALYSGTPYAGFTIFDPGYADDGLSNFATNSKRIAQSYTWVGDNATEYDPRNADRVRDEMDSKGRYLQVDEYGRYGKKANSTLFQMLNQMTDWAFGKDNDEFQELDYAAQNIKDDALRDEAVRGVEAGTLIQYAASRLASHHTASDFKELQDAYRLVVRANERLMPAAKEELERVRKVYSQDDFLVGSGAIFQDTPLLAVSSYLRTLQTGIEDALLNSGIYDVMQQADAQMRQYIDPDTGELLQQTGPDEWATPDKLYIGFDSMYKGKAQLFSEQETVDRLPTYEGEPGYYKLKLYAENPLDVDVQDQNWDNMDVMSFPSNVREKLAELYGYKLAYKTREVSRAAYETEHDAVVFRGLHDTDDIDMDEASDVIITYKPYQSKSVYNENPTTNPDIMFSTGMNIDDYIARYGQKEQNAFGQANNIRTPERVDNDAGRRFRVSDSSQTLKEVAHIRQSARNVIDEGILQQADGVMERHGLIYEPVSLDRMREIGTQYIAEHGGLTQAMRDLTRDMPRARADELAQYMSAANQVFTEIGAEGTFDPQEYYEFVASYVEMRSTWGRVGRVMQLVNDSPLGRVAYWQRVVDRLNEANQAAVQRGLNPLFYRNGADAIVVPQSFYDALAQAQTQEEIDAAEYAITQYIGQNSPLTVSDALRNWRYFAMLANPVTHMRNMLGNVTMLGGRIVKDTIASGMENAAVRMGLMGADERTHAIVLGQDADTHDFVRQLWADNADAVQTGGRDGFRQDLQEAVPKSPIRVIDRLMRWNGNLLENEDRIFLRATFTAAAAQYIQAQGLDVHNLTREQRGAIVNYATQQAQEATYRDASRLADALNQFARSGWAAQLFVDAVIPFKKTPINIFKRGIEYSPAGLARGLVDIARNASARNRGGQAVVSASVIVDELAKGLTGSMLALLGFFLAKAGILKVHAGEDDKDSAFERDIGRQDYSLEIGDLSIKIESLAPLTFPLFLGAQLQRLSNEEHDGLSLSDLTEAASTLADPMMDMSFMSGLNSVLSTYNENKIGGVVTNAAEAYLGQYLPTIGSKMNQTINTQRRTSKASQASPLGTNADYWLRSMASKVPGANQAVLEPYVKTTGEYDAKDSFGDYVLSFINNFVSPVNVQIVDTSPVNTEIARLVSATGATDFVPQNPKKYLNIGNDRYNMTAKEYTQYSKEHNETVYAVLSQVIRSEAYARMTDEQRVEVLKKAYDRAHRTIMDKYKSVFAQK